MNSYKFQESTHRQLNEKGKVIQDVKEKFKRDTDMLKKSQTEQTLLTLIYYVKHQHKMAVASEWLTLNELKCVGDGDWNIYLINPYQ